MVYVIKVMQFRPDPARKLSANMYRGADKSLALPWKATSYSDQELQQYNKTYGVQTTGIYSCLCAISVGIVL